MISYNPKDWFTFIFKIHKSETFQQLIPLMFGLGIYAFVITYFELHNLYSDNAKDLLKNSSAIFSILGFILSLLLVFRTNSAYDRWWEARKLWGDIMNSSRVIATYIATRFPSDNEAKLQVSKLLGTYAYALHAHLKNEKISIDFLNNHFKDVQGKQTLIESINDAEHQPEAVNQLMCAKIYKMESQIENSGQSLLIYSSQLNKLIEICGACERIKNTPIPFSYSVFLKKYIFFYVMLFPIVYGIPMSYIIVPATIFVLYVLASIELIAEEIENPFNGDANDISTLDLSLGIIKSVERILD